MIIEEIKNIKSDKPELKKFGYTIGIVLLIIAAVLFYLDKSGYVYFLSIGALFIALGLALPELLLPIQKIWMGFSVILGFIMTRVILSFLFYIIVTVIGLAAKIFRKDFLDSNFSIKKDSYWNYRSSKEYEKISTERQF